MTNSSMILTPDAAHQLMEAIEEDRARRLVRRLLSRPLLDPDGPPVPLRPRLPKDHTQKWVQRHRANKALINALRFT